MQKTDYGMVVDGYKAYTSDPNDSEVQLGRAPALKALGSVKGKTILDFGCGPATNGRLLSASGAAVIGLDISSAVIDEARRLDPNGDYRVYRGLLAEELREFRLDGILMSFSFCVVPDREIRYLLRDMHALLGNRGRLVIVEPNQERANGAQYKNLHYHRQEGVKVGDYVHVTLGSGSGAIELYDDIYRTHADYRSLLEEAGFTVEQMFEPLPDPSWDGDWETEKEFPPFLIIVAK